MDSRRYLSSGLILVGITWFLTNQNYIPGYLLLYVLSAGFLGAYIFVKKSLGFLIPASNIAAVAIFSTLVEKIENINGAWIIVLLGLSFLAIYVTHTRSLVTTDKGEKIWPLIPGAILSIIGLWILMGSIGEKFLQLIGLIWPLALVLAGVLILFMKKKVK